MKLVKKILLFFVLTTFQLSGQSFTDTIFFDKSWEKSERSQAEYFRIYTKSKKENSYTVYDKFMDGKIQMVSIATDYFPLLQEGLTVYYNESGYKTKKAFYKNNKEDGLVIRYYDNEGDSSVAEYSNGERKNIIRKSKYEAPDSTVFTVVEEMPQYNGGTSELMKFLSGNIHFPSALRNQMIGGKAYIRFIVDSTGAIKKSEVIKSAGFTPFDDEALRVVNEMPRWAPGKQNGVAVNVYFNLPVSFFISDTPFILYNVNNKNPNYVHSIKQYEDGDKKGALESLKEALEKESNDADILYNLAMINFQEKNKKKGCNYLDLAVKSKHRTAEKVINSFCN